MKFKTIFIVLLLIALVFALSSGTFAENDKPKTNHKSLTISNPLTTIVFEDDIESYLTEEQLQSKFGIAFNSISVDSFKYKEFKKEKATITMNSLCLKNPVAFHNGVPDYSIKAKNKGLCK